MNQTSQLPDPFEEKTSNPEYSKFIHLSRYSRWNPNLGRRETWYETVSRYVEFFRYRLNIDQETTDEVFWAIYNLEVMPSMRALMTAGLALHKDHVAGYNCAYLPVESPRDFDEAMYILMCGTGVGYSVERQYVSKLPEVPEELHPTDTTITVADSKVGWATALRELISLLYSGKVPKWDVSKIRPAGARLKTFGGRASGPEPLLDLFEFTVKLFTGAAGRRLTSLECHDLMCKIADIVVVGGVRRSAMISLSDLSDDRMRMAKNGQWWVDHPERALANNSVCYTEKPEFEVFMNEWRNLYESKCGERGIFNRSACQREVAETGKRDWERDFGTNPLKVVA